MSDLEEWHKNTIMHPQMFAPSKKCGHSSAGCCGMLVSDLFVVMSLFYCWKDRRLLQSFASLSRGKYLDRRRFSCRDN